MIRHYKTQQDRAISRFVKLFYAEIELRGAA